jgi:hypothetical protein
MVSYFIKSREYTETLCLEKPTKQFTFEKQEYPFVYQFRGKIFRDHAFPSRHLNCLVKSAINEHFIGETLEKSPSLSNGYSQDVFIMPADSHATETCDLNSTDLNRCPRAD